MRSTSHEGHRLSLNQLVAEARKSWHGVKMNQPDWSDPSHAIALTVELRADKLLIHMIFNAYWEPLDFELPPSSFDGAPLKWRRSIDTALESHNDIVPWQDAPQHSLTTCRAEARSMIVLFAVA